MTATDTQETTTTLGRRARQAKPAPSYRNLRFVGISGADHEIVTYGAESASRPGKTNLVSLDTITGEILCSCRHCETHPGEPASCWLSREVGAAWAHHPARVRAAGLSDAALVALGRATAAIVRIYQRRAGRAVDNDLARLCAARDEWRARQAPATVSEVA